MDTAKIPKGPYCHSLDSTYAVCPYWKTVKDRERQYNGWCDFLGKGDLELSKEMTLMNTKIGEQSRGDELPFPTSLLWDQCKECGINDEEPEE